jgi:propanol-preferring alcohol dehydrogenase
MATMTAYRLVGWQRPAEFMEVEVPRPGPDEVLVRVAGVGLCHTDLLFLDVAPGAFPYELPFTLGHEIAGWAHQLGSDVDDIEVGDPFVVKSRASCGRCAHCLNGHDNYCTRYETGFGSGEDGGLAPFIAVPRRCLVALHRLDPRQAGPLADAGLTSYHAVKKARQKLLPGSTAVVIGAGGLGGYAVQYLRLLSPARVIAVDVAAHRLDMAQRLGASETLLSDPSAARTLTELTGGGAEAVFDFVGTDETMALALTAARTLGTVAVVGAGGGTARVSWESVPRECEVFIPMGGTLQDLHEVVELAETGAVHIENELFPFDQTVTAYDRLRRGDLAGRAVVTPNG